MRFSDLEKLDGATHSTPKQNGLLDNIKNIRYEWQSIIGWVYKFLLHCSILTKGFYYTIQKNLSG